MGSVPRINCLLVIFPSYLMGFYPANSHSPPHLGYLDGYYLRTEYAKADITNIIKVFQLYLINYLIRLKIVILYQITSNSKAA
jgi:hypothetical protein